MRTIVRVAVLLALLWVVSASWATTAVFVGDTVWFDDNRDGIQQPGEPGIPGVIVQLTGYYTVDAGGNWVLGPPITRVTDASGHYRFGNVDALPGGTNFTVTVIGGLPSGWVLAYDSEHETGPFPPGAPSVTKLVTGNDYDLTATTNFDFGFDEPLIQQLGSIGDRVWYDTNGDGIQDAGEPGINGVTVTLWDSGGNLVATTTTSLQNIDGNPTDGGYLFTGLTAGTYEVGVSGLPSGHVPTYDLDGIATPNVTGNIVLLDGENRRDLDFGYVAQPGGWITVTQGGWGAKPRGQNPATVLYQYFATVFPSGVTIGLGKTLTFTSPQAITNFLPQGGTAGMLNGSQTNPTGKKQTGAGVLAGQVLALTLNVAFSQAGVLPSGLGALKIQSGTYAGWTVYNLLALANEVLGGNTSNLLGSISDLNDACTAVNENYDNGADRGFLAP